MPAAIGRGFPRARLRPSGWRDFFHFFSFLPVPPMVERGGLIEGQVLSIAAKRGFGEKNYFGSGLCFFPALFFRIWLGKYFFTARDRFKKVLQSKIFFSRVKPEIVSLKKRCPRVNSFSLLTRHFRDFLILQRSFRKIRNKSEI